MKRLFVSLSMLLLAGFLAVSVHGAAAQESQPVVHAVLFYSPTCGHCEYVIKEVLPPLYEKYGSQLQIIGFDVSQPQGQTMFKAALQAFGVERTVVPLLVIDDITLVGSQEIPDQFPQLIEGYLAMGGAAWPQIPGLREMLVAAAQAATSSAPGQTPPAATSAAPGLNLDEPRPVGWRERFAADAAANSIAVIVLLGMLAAAVWGIVLFQRGHGMPAELSRRAWIIPALCLVGAAVAGYLAYVEATHVSAVCGPIGDCNTVQQSPYARVFGVLSIGAFGLIGYGAMGAAWMMARLGRARIALLGSVSLFGLALAGTLFSIYLTFLEPFVIGATCAWCLTSAVLMTVIMLLSAREAGRAYALLQAKPSPVPKRARKARPAARGTRG